MTSTRIASGLLALASAALGAAVAQTAPPAATPTGRPKTAGTAALEAGAKLLQGNSPLKGFDLYLDGFHPLKHHPEIQMEAHHWCQQMNEDVAQCVLFDGNGPHANMNGLEYIISEKLFATLPADERAFWHPHNGEILSGQLVAPGIPQAAEHALMKKKMNSYGKTWHVWQTGHAGRPGDALPLGDAMLAWSFSRDGEILPGLVAARDQRLHVDTARLRKERDDLRAVARPQSGVDDLKDRFGRATRAIPGVVQQPALGPAR